VDRTNEPAPRPFRNATVSGLHLVLQNSTEHGTYASPVSEPHGWSQSRFFFHAEVQNDSRDPARDSGALFDICKFVTVI
jgi:hypothetical protein